MATNDIHTHMLELYRDLLLEFNKSFDQFQHQNFDLHHNPHTDQDQLSFELVYTGNPFDDYLALFGEDFITLAEPEKRNLEAASADYWQRYKDLTRGYCLAAGFNVDLLDQEWSSDESPAFVTVWII